MSDYGTSFDRRIMNKYPFQSLVLVILTVLLGFTYVSSIGAVDKVLKPNLSDVVRGKGWKLVNRKASFFEENGKKGVQFDSGKGEGVAWLNDYKFKNGTIEFDVKGKDVLQKSFVGIAFQAIDETNYEVVYFRPFNFKSTDADRRSHAVQYIASPDFGWKKLRDESPAKYEQPVEPAPDPNAWFHARVVIDGKKVSVFVNGATEPSLTVEKLVESRDGRIGIWVGDDSDGSFANLKIKQTK
jgi:Domain of Unknown Function (DUF1080)